MRNKIKNILVKHNPLWIGAMVMVFLAVFGVTAVSFAWLGNMITGAEEVPITTGTTEPIPMKMWIYDTIKEDSSPGWKSKDITYASDGDEIIIPAFVENTAGKYIGKYQVKDLHLGTIDNLVKVKDDNTVYFRFEIDGGENGTNLNMIIQNPADYLRIYGVDFKTGAAVTADETTLNQVKHVNENEPEPLVKYEYALSATEAVPGTEAFASINFSDAWDSKTNTSYSLTKSTGFSLSKYYLYIKITPSLKSFGKASKHLFKISPCQLFFDWDWAIEVY